MLGAYRLRAFSQKTTTPPPAAIPTYVNKGTRFVGTGGGTPTTPGSLSTDDFKILACETTGGSAVTAPSGWTAFSMSPQENSSNITRLSLFYRYHVGGDGDPTISSPSPADHLNAQIFVFRGVKLTSEGISTYATSGYSAVTSVSIPLGTSIAANQLIAIFIADGADVSSNRFSGTVETASSLDNINHRESQSTTSGDGGGINVYSGEKASAGSCGNLTGTLSTGTGFVAIILHLTG